ncbi:kinase non-catalytic C-lobe domain-containing protein 1 [Pteronotus mesoamericanus]|uniref:kinase non-catalytic C-lobe domain-containing protein 1 n=1 Tax=Pteronotus mesoamericanus TaxID=1884717 RepID=UPI0023EE1522|nr:kinase non-catalytic C-lobe domain-containing protein 1 [Pteronotus parnellii mesoamericanus]
MQAMEPAAADFYEEDGKDLDFYDFEPLPTLPEDEENVSLADILSLRDGGLSEQEAWAVCLECSLSMRSVAHSALFRTLCISPDTLAFNTSGNVCFMEQLSDDPEGAFVPPEFDVTGNTFEAHIYSLGATLKAALEYVAEPEPRLSHDLEALLDQMQAEDPRDRPDLESVIALCEEKMQLASSCRLCRSLSAAGRRVLSIESFGAFQEVSESAWRGRPAPRGPGPRRQPGELSPGPEALLTPQGRPQTPACDPRALPCKRPLSPPVRNGESHRREGLASLILEAQRPAERGRLRKVQTVPRLLPDGPEVSALGLPLTGLKNQLPASDFFPPDLRKAVPEGKNSLAGFKAQPKTRLQPGQEPEPQQEGARGAGPSGDGETEAPGQGPVTQRRPPHAEDTEDAGRAPGADGKAAERAGEPGGAAAEQGVSLQDLLSKLGRPFKEYELWALAHACLSALRAPRQHPACLCPDSVLVAEDGAVLFGAPAADGTSNSFFLAPEVAEQKLVTEKASVYCVAAVLWTAAKFSVPRDHKLALPRRLKTLLLEMARRSAQERPSVAEAIKVCGSYLLQRGMDSRKILAHLRASTCKVDQEEETISLQNAFPALELTPGTAPNPRPSSGAVQVGSDARLTAVQGPVPALPAGREGPVELPVAFASPATPFRPIVLAPGAGVARDAPAGSSGPAEGPEPTKGRRDVDGDVDGKKAPEGQAVATSLETPDQLAPGPGSGGPAPGPSGALVPRGLASGGACPPAPASSVMPPSSAPAPPPKAQEPVAPGQSSSGLGPRTPGPAAAPQGPLPPAKPPRSRAAKGPSQEPQGPPSIPLSPSRADMSPGGPRGAPDSLPERPRPADRKLRPPGADASPAPKSVACPSLQEATRLIQEEFAFDGYLGNGLEALIMGEYIHALRDLTYATFCGAVAEKFCDLYWGERLLQSLFQVVNGPAPPPKGASEEAASQPEASGRAGTPSGCSPSSHRPALQEAGEDTPATRGSRPLCPPPSLSEVDSDELSRGNLEVGFRPQTSVKAEREHLPEAGEDRRPVVGAEPARGASDVEAMARLAGPEKGGPAMSPGPAEFQSCSPGWSSAFYEADCFGTDIHNYVRELGGRKAGGAPDASSLELEQQLMMEQRTYRKTLKFYQKLLQKEKRSKGSEVRMMLSKLKGQLEETTSKVQFLGLVKKYLQVLHAEQWGLEPCALPLLVNVAAAHCGAPDFSPLDESSSLIFYNVSKHPRGGRQRKARVLQAGTPLGLMAYLYSRDAFLEGYVQQFLYTFRYFCTPQDFLHFLLDRISSTLGRAQQDPTSTFTKIYRRSLCLLQAWVEDCHAVDFSGNAGLRAGLADFVSSKILPLDGSAERLLGLLEAGADRRAEGGPRGPDTEDPRPAEEDAGPLNALCKRLSEDGIARKSFPWRLSRGNGLALPHHKQRQYSIASALPKPCFLEDRCSPYAKASEKGPYFLTEYSTHQLFAQLTLLQQDLFQRCHPVHFLNSRALGVMDRSAAIPKASSSESLSAKTCSLFLPDYIQDRYLLQLLRSADDVSTWVAAEIVTSHSAKLQVNLLSKFLLIAKLCYEQRNFATAMQILDGLEHPAVRQSPAWRILPAKIAEVMEELKAVEVFLKSDSLCLMEGRRFRAQPTLPAARLLAMHIQQLETGGFTMTNGAHRWNKLRNIAKVASQVHAFQENPYTFAPDAKLQSCLRQRMARFSGADVALLAADSRPGSRQAASEKHSRKIQDKLRRMKATLQ